MEEQTTQYEMTQDGKQILKRIPFTGVRKAISNNLVNSWTTAVTVGGWVKFDVFNLKECKSRLAAEGHKVTYTALFTKLLAAAIELNPEMNAALIEKKIEVYKSVNVGIATASPDGMLLVPVVKFANEKSIVEVNDEIKALGQKVFNKTITQEELSGGTVTLSSLGNYDTYGMGQVLVAPQALILGFGKIRYEAVVNEDNMSIVPRPIMYVSTTVDHRIIQGEPCSKFMMTLNQIFQEPDSHIGM